MPFDPSKFDGTILMLLVLTLGMMAVRMKARLDNNWPVFYWVLILAISYSRTDTWQFNIVSGGAIAALLLRFEFMAPGVVTAIQMVEFAVWGYVLWQGWQLISF